MKHKSVRFCVKCGARFSDYSFGVPNYCPNCGVRVKSSYDGKVTCSICHDPICSSELIRCPYCEHFFHYKCLATWLTDANACPFCMNAYLTPGRTH